MSTKLYTPKTWVDTPAASRDPMSEFNVNREIHDQIDFLQHHPYAHLNPNTAQTLTTGTVTVITWNSPAIEDDDSMFNPNASTSRLTAPLAGVYEIVLCLLYGSNVTGRRLAGIQKNGSSANWKWRTRQATNAGAAATEVSVSADVPLAVGDYVEALGWQDSGGNLAVGNGSGDSYLQARWVRR